MAKIAVLGLGPSLAEFVKEDYELSIGVNDIWRYVNTEVVVCLDHEKVFNPDRMKWIRECNPQAFYSQIVNWDYRNDFVKIDFNMVYPDRECDLKKYRKSYCSPFVAVQVAWRDYGATEIHLFGVDLTAHPRLNATLCMKIKRHFILLKQALKVEGCELVVHGDGILRDI